MNNIEQLFDSIRTGNATAAETAVRGAFAAGADPAELVSPGMIPAMDEVGKRFECNENFVPELLIAQSGMNS